MAELLERDALLAALAETAAQATAHGCVVLVGGEAGVGKTALLDRFAATLAAGRVLRGGCEALTTPRPLGPLHDIAAHCGGALTQLLAAPAASAGLLFQAVLDELAAPPAPTVLVFEDVHWADAATLDLVKFLGRRMQRVPALLLLSHRDDAASLDRLRPLLGELPPAHVRRLQVPPLSRAAVDRLAAAAQRSDAARIHAATGGNAFFVAELLRQGLPADGSDVPATVRDAVLARAASLAPAARQVLELVAIVPREADLALLQAVLAPAPDAVDGCIGAGLLVAAGRRLRFRHELARSAVEAAIPPLRAADRHARVLAALAARPAGSVALAALVHHAQGADDAAAVLRWAPAAAREAAARGSRREAVAHCRAALAHADALPDADRAALLDTLAAHSFELNDLDAAIDARTRAAALYARCGAPDRQSASLSALAMALVRALRNDEADAASRLAIALAAPLQPATLARALATESYLRMLNRDAADAIAHGLRAVALATAAGDAYTAARAQLSTGAAQLFVDRAAGRARLEALLDLAPGLADGGALLADAHQMLATGSAELHDFDTAERHLAAGLAVARGLDLDRVAGYMDSWQAMCDLFRGRWDRAGERAHAAVRSQAQGSTNRVVALVALARLRTRRGDPGADALLDEALALADRSGTLQRLGLVAAARAEAALTRGDAGAACVEADRAIALAARKRHPWLLGELAYWHALAAPDAADIDPAACAAPYRLQIGGDWQAAAAAWRTLGCPFETARALAEGDAAARREAVVALDRLGARPLADRVRRSLREAGARDVPRAAASSTRAHAAGLTRREAEVLELLAAGLRNAQIAARLSRSTRTVEHHVEAVLAKLGAASREAAVAAARDRGLLTRDG